MGVGKDWDTLGRENWRDIETLVNSEMGLEKRLRTPFHNWMQNLKRIRISIGGGGKDNNILQKKGGGSPSPLIISTFFLRKTSGWVG